MPNFKLRFEYLKRSILSIKRLSMVIIRRIIRRRDWNRKYLCWKLFALIHRKMCCYTIFMSLNHMSDFIWSILSYIFWNSKIFWYVNFVVADSSLWFHEEFTFFHSYYWCFPLPKFQPNKRKLYPRIYLISNKTIAYR